MAQLGIDAGCGDGRFCPDEPISRAEMAVWLYRANALLQTPLPLLSDEAGTGFSDVADDDWYGPMALWAAANGVIGASGRAFDPDGAVTRADAAVMLTAAFEHLAAADEIQGVFADTTYAAGAIEGIHAAGLTKGCATGPLRYCPNQPITRGQAAAMLARAVQRAEPTVGLTVNEPQAARGYTLIQTRFSDAVHLIDHLGRKVHAWNLSGYKVKSVKLLENGNLLLRHRRAYPEHWLAEVNRDGTIVWEYPVDGIHHDYLQLPTGNMLLLMKDTITPQEAIAAGADPNLLPSGGLVFDYLREVKPTGPDSSEIVWEWSTLDHLVQDHDPDKSDYGTIAAHPRRIDINYSPRQNPFNRDFFHINSIDYDPIRDQIMLSSRHYSELWIIDHNTTTEEAAGSKGDLLYRWGNPRAYGAGDHQHQRLFWQHNIHWIPQGLPGEGNVLIFNNGNEFPGVQRNYSSIDEITLPAFQEDTYPQDQSFAFKPARPQWNYTSPQPADFYSSIWSGVQRLPNGNTQICDSLSGIVFQVTPDGTTVWEYINPVPRNNDLPVYQGATPFNQINSLYRAPWYPTDYPGLKNMDLTPKGPIERYR